MHFTRRRLVAGGIGALAAISAIPFFKFATLSDPRNFIISLPPALYDQKLGKLFIGTLLKGVDADHLYKLLHPKFSWWLNFNEETIIRDARRAFSEDYRHGLVMETDGWLLPETAVYLCGLAALEKN